MFDAGDAIGPHHAIWWGGVLECAQARFCHVKQDLASTMNACKLNSCWEGRTARVSQYMTLVDATNLLDLKLPQLILAASLERGPRRCQQDLGLL